MKTDDFITVHEHVVFKKLVIAAFLARYYMYIYSLCNGDFVVFSLKMMEPALFSFGLMLKFKI